jgi:hypothetical protein
MKVYALSEGEYSDYHIIAIYSTKEKADAALAEFNREAQESYEKAGLEEYELDSYTPSTEYYSVGVKPDGMMQYVMREVRQPGDQTARERRAYYASHGDCLCLFIDVDTREAAIKIAKEKWAKIASAGLWGKTEALPTI